MTGFDILFFWLRSRAALLSLCCLLLGLSGYCFAQEKAFTLYTQRHYEFDEALHRQFLEKTGIEINVVKAGADELIARLMEEGDHSPADLFMTADGSGLDRARVAGLLQPIGEGVIPDSVPATLQDPERLWVAVTKRARVLVYAKDRVNPSELSTYEDLADSRWRGRLLSRSSSNAYNQSLMTTIVAANGAEEAGRWAAAVRQNMARPPQGSDRDQIRAVALGLADVALVNTYYLGLLQSSEDKADRDAAEKVKIFFPNQDGRGAHINVSGAGVVKNAKNAVYAEAYLAFLLSPGVQTALAKNTFEYPVNEEASWSPVQTEWGSFRSDEVPLATLGQLNAEAVRLFNRAGWE